MVPVQYWVLSAAGVDPTLAMRIALGTNLVVVLPTAASSVRVHHRNGFVVWRAAVVMGLTGIVGAFLGAGLACRLPDQVLRAFFGAFVIFGGLRMLFGRVPAKEGHPPESYWPYVLWGLPCAFISGVVGVGGGAIMIPVMVYFLSFSIHQAVATSSATMIITGASAAASFAFHGLGVAGLPPYSTGYVNWLQVLLLTGTSIPMAMVGARTAHRLPAERLRQIFVLLMIYVGLKMIGVFAWLGLPI